MIKIFAYDDNEQRLLSLQTLLDMTENIQYLGGSACCECVEAEMEQYQPDVVLMDLNMPIVDGLQGLKMIKTKYPHIKVLIQTAFDDSDKIFNSISNGASGYILKSDNPGKLLQAIEEVYQGGAAMNPAIAQKVLDYFIPRSKDKCLTPKENEVLKLLAEGNSYKMIADRLGISYSTVNTHIKHIYAKLHISSLGEAVSWYYKNNKE